MDLTKLPEHILIIIIRKLDTQSQDSLYSACQYFRDMICHHTVIKVCNLSKSVLATVDTLKSDFFIGISTHLRELNLCELSDLVDTASLLPSLRNLKRLETLDISFTNMNLIDMSDIYEACPTLRNITIDFTFSYRKIEADTYSRCQSVFQNFKNVHFVGTSATLIHKPDLVFYILDKAKLNSLKYTISETRTLYDIDLDIEFKNLPQFNEFTINFFIWFTSIDLMEIRNLPVLKMIELKNYEIIVITLDDERIFNCNLPVYASSVFHSFFIDNFNIVAEDVTDKHLTRKVVMMLWNKRTTEFDDYFFCKLRKQVSDYLPYVSTSPEIPALDGFGSFSIWPKEPDNMSTNKSTDEDEPAVKRNMNEATNVVLNYDTIFKDKYRIQLQLGFLSTIPRVITLTQDCSYLKKLTYLRLVGDVEYSQEFFHVLFRCCDNLVTLDVSNGQQSCCTLIADSISLNRSLKNFRFAQNFIPNIRRLIIYLCECPNLENIHIEGSNVEGKISSIVLPLRKLLHRCKNLQSLFIDSKLDTKNCERIYYMIKTASEEREKNKRYFSTTINRNTYFGYSPFMNAYNIRPPLLCFKV